MSSGDNSSAAPHLSFCFVEWAGEQVGIGKAISLDCRNGIESDRLLTQLDANIACAKRYGQRARK